MYMVIYLLLCFLFIMLIIFKRIFLINFKVKKNKLMMYVIYVFIKNLKWINLNFGKLKFKLLSLKW